MHGLIAAVLDRDLRGRASRPDLLIRKRQIRCPHRHSPRRRRGAAQADSLRAVARVVGKRQRSRSIPVACWLKRHIDGATGGGGKRVRAIIGLGKVATGIDDKVSQRLIAGIGESDGLRGIVGGARLRGKCEAGG